MGEPFSQPVCRAAINSHADVSGASCCQRLIRPAIAAPRMGASQTHRCSDTQGGIKNLRTTPWTKILRHDLGIEAGPELRGKDAHWFTVPTPSNARPQAVSIAWRIEPRRATRSKKRKFSQWKLDGRGYRGAQVAAVSSAVVCNNGIGE